MKQALNLTQETQKTNHQLKEIKTDYELVYKYSDEPKELKKTLQRLDITFEHQGRKFNYFGKADNVERCVLKVYVYDIESKTKISFDYGMSQIDSKNLAEKEDEIYSKFLYDILASVRAEYDIPESYSEFCAEFGYPEPDGTITPTYAKNYALYKKCKVHSEKLQRIFNEDEINNLPS